MELEKQCLSRILKKYSKNERFKLIESVLRERGELAQFLGEVNIQIGSKSKGEIYNTIGGLACTRIVETTTEDLSRKNPHFSLDGQPHINYISRSTFKSLVIVFWFKYDTIKHHYRVDISPTKATFKNNLSYLHCNHPCNTMKTIRTIDIPYLIQNVMFDEVVSLEMYKEYVDPLFDLLWNYIYEDLVTLGDSKIIESFQKYIDEIID